MRFDDFADTHHITEPVDTGIICLIKKEMARWMTATAAVRNEEEAALITCLIN